MNVSNVSTSYVNTSKVLSKAEKGYFKKLFPGETKQIQETNYSKKLYNKKNDVLRGSTIDIRI